MIHAAAGNISNLTSTWRWRQTPSSWASSLCRYRPAHGDMEGMDIHIYEIIYRLVDDVEKALKYARTHLCAGDDR